MTRRTLAFALHFVFFAAALSWGGTAGQVLWQIGQFDGRYDDLAIPGRSDQFMERFGNAENVYRIGQSRPEKDFPYIQPGPLDDWAKAPFARPKGSKRQRPMRIEFACDAVPATDYVLTVGILKTDDREPATFQVDVNGRRATFDLKPQAAGSQQIVAVFPAAFLKRGINTITLSSVQGQGATYDAVKLATSSPGRMKRSHFSSLPQRPVDYVDVFLGSGIYNRTFQTTTASMPFGMVKLTPDTGGGTYDYNARTVDGLCHLHSYCLGGLNAMPTVGPVRTRVDEFRSPFSKTSERATPGYHRLRLDRYGIEVELTSTKRVGLHRYVFPKSEQANILLDVGRRIGETASLEDSRIEKSGPDEISGHIDAEFGWRTKDWTKVYFVARFSKPFDSFGMWREGKILPGREKVDGKDTGAYVTYRTKDREAVLMKFAVSYVSLDNARKNMSTELPGWDFEAARNAAVNTWNDTLKVFEVQGGRREDRIKFYTGLWHAMLGRDTISDADGSYSVHGQVRQTPAGETPFPHYNTDAVWNTFWNLNGIWSLGYPDVMNGWVRFLLNVYDYGGYLPCASVGNAYSQMMIGSPETPMIVGAYMKGIRNYDADKAYAAIRKQHTTDGVPYYDKEGFTRIKGIKNIELYRKLGYVPNVASETLEYCYQDWCVAQMARALGRQEDAKLFASGAQNYRNIWDPETGFLRPRNADGTWPENFDPFVGRGYTEATGWQYLWFVPHDIQGLISLIGGDEPFCRKLTFAFEQSRAANFAMDHVSQSDVKRYLNYGNQAALQPAHLFNYAAKPWLSQYWTREILNHAFGHTAHDGYWGDEDQGQLGAWFTFVSMGLFHVNGGASLEPFYDITTPLFDQVIIHLDHRYYPGRAFVIRTLNNSAENRYIQKATLNGRALDQCWIYHKDVVKGGELVLELGPRPNPRWATRGPRPPS